MHKTIVLNNIPIDYRMAPLINLCWKLKIKTKYCCQGECYIMFHTVEDGMNFIEKTKLTSFYLMYGSREGPDRPWLNTMTIIFSPKDIFKCIKNLKAFL